ncbi:hypothetical protein TNCV_1913291 [Trichonephila clavipes]|nr:hypothetical protein TNCV_1913291 [Trichonephila clavipes]
MSRAFSSCLLPPNFVRLIVVLQRVQILAVIPLKLIDPRLAAVNVHITPHRKIGSRSMVNLHIAAMKLGKQSTDCPLTCHSQPHIWPLLQPSNVQARNRAESRFSSRIAPSRPLVCPDWHLYSPWTFPLYNVGVVGSASLLCQSERFVEDVYMDSGQ